MYIELYDESKDLYERVASFKNKSNTLLERYGNGAAQHYQYENAIMTYLWLRYPDKYYIYKLSEVKAVSSELESDYRFKKGAYADNIRNFVAFYDEICAELQQDDELKNLLNSQLTSTCYADPELRTLTIDVGFFISRYWNKEEPGPKADEWWPTDYTPALTVEDWLELLTDKDVFNESSLEIMKRMKDYGGKATCTQLAVKYGETKNFYNSGSVALARRIVQKTGCPVIARDEENSRFWPVLYVGKNAAKDEEGSYVWKLRDELAEALDQVDLSEVLLYAQDEEGEEDHRYNGLSFSVPKRLHIIGMMNTADRSLAMIDYALRRRFSFFDMEPGFDSEGFIKYQEGFANDTFNTLIDRIKELNQEIAKDKSLGKGFCIGHSYFCNTDECTEEWMQDVVDFDVLPMLAEYWFDDTDKLQRWENILHGVFQ